MGKSNNINNNNNNNEYEYDGDNSGWRRKDRRQRRGSRSQQQSQQQTSYHHNHNHHNHNHHHHRPVRKKLLLLFDPIAVCVLLGSLGILLLQFATFSVLNQSLEDSGKSSWLTTLSIVSIDDINNDGLQRRQHGRIERSLVDTDTDTDTDTDDANDEDDGDGSGSGSGDHDETETDTKPKQQQQQQQQHYPPLLHHNYKNNNNNNNGVGIIPKQPMLVVGGSDGSGTRAVVALLRELGCIVVADDRSTFDVHLEAIASVQNGHETRGWPSLVERVFSNFGRDGVFQRQRQRHRHRQREIASESDGNGNGKNTNTSSNTNSKDKNTNTTNNSDYSFNFEWPPRERSRNEAVATSLEKDVRKALKRLTGQFHQEENSRKIAYEKRKQSVDTDKDTDTQQQQHKYSVHLGNRRGVKEQTVFAGHTEDVAYAIKAPASMLILPLLASSVASFYRTQHKNATPPTLKFLHVVRDGRDVALSENQSPVHKFYNLTYPKVTDDPQRAGISSFAELLENNKNNNNNNKNRTKNTNSTTTTHSNSTTTTTTTKNNSTTASLEDSVLYGRAMQLWNDWNVKVHEWANDPLRNRRADDHAPAVEYMMVRSEDLLVPNTVERLDALKALASFVGSSLTPEELCVLARRDPKDYGISQVGPGILGGGGGGGGGKQHPYVNRFGAMARDFKWRPNALRLPRDTTPWKGKPPPPPPPPAAPSPPLPLPPPVSDERPKSSQARRRLSSLATSSADHHEDEQEQEQDGETKPLTESERIRVTQLEQDYGGWKKMVASVLRQRTVVDSIYDSLLRSGELLLYRCKQLPQRLQQSFFSAKKNHGGEVDPEHWIDMLRYRKERAAKRREKQQNNNNTNTNNDYKQRRGRGRGRVGRARVKVPLQKRYGKWKAVLDGNPELSEFFYRAGAEGLEVFGYHPYRPARYDRGNTNTNGNGNDTTTGAAQTGTYLCPMNSTHGSSDGAQ